MSSRDRFLIAQISDTHFGDPRFDPALAETCLDLVERAEPDLVLVPGDLTAQGYREEFEQAAEFLGRLSAPWLVVPGNHDERNVGWRTYERLFGPRWHAEDVAFGVATRSRGCESMRVVSCDSAEPDLDDGELGRVRHSWIAERFEGSEDAFRVVMLHHHLVAIPNTGRERNTVSDAGDVLVGFEKARVDLVLNGHKHVPHVWTVNGVPIVTSGTATSWRTRGEVPPSFNLIEVLPERIVITMTFTSGAPALEVTLPRAGDSS